MMINSPKVQTILVFPKMLLGNLERKFSSTRNLILSALQRRAVDKNEAVRKGMAKKLIEAYNRTNKDLTQISIELSNTLTLTQVNQ